MKTVTLREWVKEHLAKNIKTSPLKVNIIRFTLKGLANQYHEATERSLFTNNK